MIYRTARWTEENRIIQGAKKVFLMTRAPRCRIPGSPADQQEVIGALVDIVLTSIRRIRFAARSEICCRARGGFLRRYCRRSGVLQDGVQRVEANVTVLAAGRGSICCAPSWLCCDGWSSANRRSTIGPR